MSQNTTPAIAHSAIRPASVDALEELVTKLAGAHAVLDLIFVLEITGDPESLSPNTRISAISEAMTRIDESRNLMGTMAAAVNVLPELHRALLDALVVVAGCNGDGAFDDQERAIRDALDKAERVAA